jgi:3-isopropylmalate/(R)-2-methylmalate dehydratase large subunit
MPGKNIIQKIWDAHVIKQLAGHPAVVAIDFMLVHEVTSAQAFQVLRERNLQPLDAGALLATLDHSIPTRKNRLEIYDQSAKKQVETLRQNCKEFVVPLIDFEQGQGIVHIIGPEFGITQPGMTIVCGDSHTSTHGAFGALAFGIGTSEVGHVLATGCLLLQAPKTMLVRFDGKFKQGVFAKDAILRLIAEIGIGGANGHVIEYAGSAISGLRMDERMTICNMSIECGARAGLVAPDQITFDYIKGRKFAPRPEEWSAAIGHWSGFTSDADASFDKEIKINVDELAPMVTWGTNPGQAASIFDKVPMVANLPLAEQTSARQALEYIGLSEGQTLQGIPVDWAFIGSCTNGRIEDLRVAAQILKGRQIAKGVTFYVVPGSESVAHQAEAEGLVDIFKTAGVDFRMPGCSLCLGMNDDRVPAGARCISSSNRNFVGRQGTGSRTHLASPATVAASAVAGKICSPEEYL